MKTKQLFLIAMSAALGLFGAGTAWAQQGDTTHLANNIRIESITKVAAEPMQSLPLTAGSKIYFDVRLTDLSGAASAWEFVGNSLNTTNLGTRPYLTLNIPLKGVSDKGIDDLGSGQVAEGESTTMETSSAVAFYVGQGPNAQTLRFAYTVRPGDMTEAITWACGADGAPSFGGNIGNIQLTYRDPNNLPSQPTVMLVEQVLKGTTGGAVAEDTANVWPVTGYVFTIGDGSPDFNTDMFYQGLVPVTISTAGNAATSVFAASNLANQCGLWVEAYDEDSDAWRQVPAGITRMTSDGATITQGAYGEPLVDAGDFSATYFGRANGPTDAAAESFEPMRFFVNVPASVPAGTTVRLCYGVRKDNGTTQTTFATQEYTLEESPIIAGNAMLGGYSLMGADVDAGEFELPPSGLTDPALNGATVNGATVNAGAGETTLIQIYKTGIDGLANYGTVYAVIERVSIANGALSTFERNYVPLNPDPSAETYSVGLTIGDNAANGESYYRIWVPQLEALNGATGSIDNPFYLKVVSSPKRETINFVSSEETGTLGLEYYQPAPSATGETAAGQSSFLKYTLTVASAEPTTRRFLIYPVDSTGEVRITPDATFVNRTSDGVTPVNAFDAISQYVVLQNQAGSILPSATAQLIVTVPANQTSATFYVALVNDYPQNVLNGQVNIPGRIDPVNLQGVSFAAKGCNSQGTITGNSDECLSLVVPQVQDRAPTILSSSAPSTGATGTRLVFTYSVVDVASDYLVVQLNHGDGTTESRLYVDEEAMCDLLGQAAWESERAQILAQFGITDQVGDVTVGGSGIYPRSSFGTETVTFYHTYNAGTNPAWVMTVTDSSRLQASTQGQITLSTSQRFTFYTLYNPTIPGAGYVLWDNSTTDDPVAAGWSFGNSYTYNALNKDGNTNLFVTAHPFAAGDATPPGFDQVSADRDSFFYKWAVDHQDYAALLPQGDALYESSLSFSRAFVAGGGEAQTSADWQDITLRAIFVAEWLPGDAIEPYERSRQYPYLYNLGDYNQDGVPDGWLLSAMGESEATRAVIEGGDVSRTAPEGDNLPALGWGPGDAAYRFGAAAGSIAVGNYTATGTAFGYKMRVRGRDDALNAATGPMGKNNQDSSWLSNPQWVVLMRPEVDTTPDDEVRGPYAPSVGTIDLRPLNPPQGDAGEATYSASWQQVRLATQSYGGTVAFLSARYRIPYIAGADGIPSGNDHMNALAAAGWRYVADADGNAIRPSTAANAPYHCTAILVNTNEQSPDYTQIRLEYTQWGYWKTDYETNPQGQFVVDERGNRVTETVWVQGGQADATGNPALFPFTTPAETSEVFAAGAPLDETLGAEAFALDVPALWNGGTYAFSDDTYHFVDARVANGMLIDEPFRTSITWEDGTYDPRLTSWLDRFSSTTSADQDADGLTNGIEYYFWYYASRIAYGSVFTHEVRDGSNKVTATYRQLNTALWPAIDLRERKAPNTGSDFTMGRAFNPDYNPDSENQGQGNLWTPISAAKVLDVFHPLAGSTLEDLDQDGLSTIEEIAIGTNPIDFDSDGDGMPDGWENHFGLDPLAADADGNPDRDYFARATVTTFPDYHHLFRVEAFSASSGVVVPQGRVAFYDYEGGTFYTIAEASIPEDHTTAVSRTACSALGSATMDDVQTWSNESAIFLEIPGRQVVITDFAVYQTFGFNPCTGWTDGLTPNVPGDSEKFAVFSAENTAAFTNIEEFRSAVRRVRLNPPETMSMAAIVNVSTDPTNADTNGDGAPDGWEAYVGLDPTNSSGVLHGSYDQDADGLTAAQEFQCRLVNLMCDYTLADGSTWWPASLRNAAYDPAVGGWSNKVLPSDPWNPDSDFDGLADGAEGTVFTYAAADDYTFAGGGCDPNRMDTDMDGMPDGWEFRYGSVVAVTNTATVDGETVATQQYQPLAGAPDPTSDQDWGLDYDRDGLPNYQEYLTGILRHLRYDLSPEAARLYKDVIGELTESATSPYGYEWKTLPNAYAAMEDLVNPSSVQSPLYATYLGGPLGADERPLLINPLRQAIANHVVEGVGAESPLFTAVQDNRLRPAVSDAFNYLWTSSIFFPTAEQAEAYKINPEPSADNLAAVAAYQAVLDLQEQIVALDAAYRRLLDNDASAARTLIFLIGHIDGLLEDYADGTYAFQGTVAELIQGEAKTLWAARRTQLLRALNERGADTAYTQMAARTKTTFTNPLADDFTASMNAAANAYEAAVTQATNPLVQSQYRAAVRGFSGGVWVDGVSGLSYLAPLGYHLPLRTFAARRAGKDIAFLGERMDAGDLGEFLPTVSANYDYFMTTSPLVADTDMDGMDDYWEVFHGLNPLLGDYTNKSYDNADSTARGSYSTDKLNLIYTNGALTNSLLAKRTYNGALSILPKPTGNNNFGNPALEEGAVTGYDYYTYPWLAGVPFADPDGDGLINSEEAVNPNNSVQRYGTDPSPLWMTDPSNPNSFVARFYGRLNANLLTEVPIEGGAQPDEDEDVDDGGGIDEVEENPGHVVIDATGTPLLYRPAAAFDYFTRVTPTATPSMADSVLPYEVNEGFDTDGDGIPDMEELTHATVFRGDPQSLRTPDRQQSAYLDGEGAMQSLAETQFGPNALTTFTIECWVKPNANQTANEVILIDRPWRFDDDATSSALRHNFRLGLRASSDGTFLPFANYTGSGTTYENSESTPQVSPTAVSGTSIKAGEWTHVAATYDGATLRLVVNGVESGTARSALIPGNGVLAVKNDGLDEVQRFTYRSAPILIGATPSNVWLAGLEPVNEDGTEPTFADFYTGAYSGYIDEVRIWNGARTVAQIATDRSRSFSQAELLTMRLNVLQTRLAGEGYFETNVPTELLASYSFSDLLAGSRTQREDEESGETVYDIDESPWETYPGEKLIGGATTPGSFLFRRSGFQTTLDTIEQSPYFTMPTVEELFTSYYALNTPKTLLSKQYTEREYVPVAHSLVSHLPLADVERGYANTLVPHDTKHGSPKFLYYPSGSAANLKPADSVYWTPYGAGVTTNASPTAIYNVKVEANPYGYRYNAVYVFDVASHRTLPAYAAQVAPDLHLYGSVFARYDEKSWDDSPSTDPSGGAETEEKPGSGEGGNGLEWFEHVGDPVQNGLADKENSAGGAWLENYVGLGQTKDSDGDLMPNWWENYYGLDPEDPTGVNGPHGDPDGDFLTNYAEWLAKSDPHTYSTANNGVPDFHIPIWARRGRPTFGLLYTDNDFMEDHWEASNRTETLTVDLHDAAQDSDNDGWSNWAEARANFRTGRHSTNPNARTSVSQVDQGTGGEGNAAQAGSIVREHPTPAFRLTVDYFGDQNVYTNALANAAIVVHTYTATNNNSAPDASFHLPLTTSSDSEDTNSSLSQVLGNWRIGSHSGYLHMGNIIPGSLRIRYTRDTEVTTGGQNANYIYVDILADSKTVGDVADLYILRDALYDWDNDGTYETNGTVRETVGTINYRTGYYTLDFSASNEYWTDGTWYVQDDTLGIVTYDLTEFVGTASYRTKLEPGQSNTFTLVTATEGYIREGINNFFVFADLNGDGVWNDGEPAGIPDQHDVDFGFDLVNKPLHVTLTEIAPPGSVRFDVAAILEVLEAELGQVTGSDGGESSSIQNPVTGGYLKPSYFSEVFNGTPYVLKLTQAALISTGNEDTTLPGTVVFSKTYNIQKPYISEDEIFAARPEGLPHAGSKQLDKIAYNVFLIPKTLEGAGYDGWTQYAIGSVTNVVGSLDESSTQLVGPAGGTVRHNSELTFEWLCNVQVPTITLTITKIEDALGNKVSQRVYERTVRGVSPIALARGNGDTVQYRYRYTLPRGIGELNADGTALFGDGLYDYTLTLNPYNGESHSFNSSFRLQLRASGDEELAETKKPDGTPAQDTSFNAQDSYYVRARINYTGVLKDTEDFDGAKLVVEAHYSGSFNGDPIAATSDILCYDGEDEGTDALNRTVKMSKDESTLYKVDVPTGKGEETEKRDAFWVTRFDVELRGLPSADAVYLMAYFDLNQNGKRDAWEPWGYATQGTDSVSGFYFDPRPVTPARSGKEIAVTFYIQDVDTDNDKLADAWEWRNNGWPTEDFSEWCNHFKGTVADHTGSAIWTKDEAGNLALTAYGAQLYGLKVIDGPDANGAVKVEGMPDDLEEARELMGLLGDDTAFALFAEGYKSFGLTVTGVNVTPDGQVSLTWDVTGAIGVEDGGTYDITGYFTGATSQAIYAVYGKADLGDTTWHKLGEIKTAGTLEPNLDLNTADCVIKAEDGTERKATFFKVILSAKQEAKATRAD